MNIDTSAASVLAGHVNRLATEAYGRIVADLHAAFPNEPYIEVILSPQAVESYFDNGFGGISVASAEQNKTIFDIFAKHLIGSGANTDLDIHIQEAVINAVVVLNEGNVERDGVYLTESQF